MVQIFVRNLEGRSVAVNVNQDSSVADVKNELHVREKIAPEEQRLSMYGRPLFDDRALIADYGIQSGSTLELSLELRGGMPKKGGDKKGKKGKEKKAKEPAEDDGLDGVSVEELKGQIHDMKDGLKKEMEERNYFQLERDKINTFWEITKKELEEKKAELRNKDR
jgi:hypothetical protein